MINIIIILVQREQSLSELTTKNDKVLFSQTSELDTPVIACMDLGGEGGGGWRMEGQQPPFSGEFYKRFMRKTLK